MKVKKVVSTNENLIYPNCYQCRKELSPYLIWEIEKETLILLKESNSIIDYLNDKPVALLCKKCCKNKAINNG